MSSLNMIRQAASMRVATRSLVSRTSARVLAPRTYATPSQQPDPQLNGYPELPWIPRGSLPARGWDDMLERRNFGESIHEQEEVLSMWGPDVPNIDPNVAFGRFMVAVATFVTFGFTVKYFLTLDPPVVRREYPYNGLVTELGGLEENKARPESLDDSE